MNEYSCISKCVYTCGYLHGIQGKVHTLVLQIHVHPNLLDHRHDDVPLYKESVRKSC